MRSGAGNFGGFVEETFDTAYRFAFCLSLAHDRAARLVETTFHEADLLGKSDSNAVLDKTWVLETLHRKWRACHPVPPLVKTEDLPASGEALATLEEVDELECDAVLKVLHGMIPAYRLVLSLFYFEQLSHHEIARIVDLPSETVLTRLAQAKVSLRQMLGRSRPPAISADGPG
ncbi:MAG: hypothetical protein H0T83_04815 [Chthoniobacterales bacterium]|nr:hypothetical protein [Chthoniobacterales bacterium]